MSGLFGPSGGPSRPSLDFSVLEGYYLARSQSRASAPAQQQRQAQAVSFAPWDQRPQNTTPLSQLREALSATTFVDTRNTAFDKPGVAPDHKKLFALYKGLSQLRALASRASEESTPLVELTGLNRRFEAGLDEIKSYLTDKTFADLTVQFGERSSKANSEFRMPRPPSLYSGPALVNGESSNAVPGLTGTEVFTVTAAKSIGSVPVTMDLSEIVGDLSLDNVLAYMNGKMQDAGLLTRFTRTVFDGKTSTDPKRYGLGVQTVATERITLSAASTQPAVYLAGLAGTGKGQSGQLLKLTDEGAGVANNFTAKIAPQTGTADVRATATDANGNVFVVGSVTGDLGPALVQGDQDVYLRKYDAAGQLVWSRMLGSSDHASGLALAVDGSGNVAIAGRVTDRLTSTGIGGGGDTFVSKYDADGRELFTRQISPTADDQANALAFGADGSLFVAGQTKAPMGSGITQAGGDDAYLMKLTSTGALEYVRQFGGTGDDRATAIAVDGNGDVVLGTVENGEAKVRKLLSGDGTSDPVWEMSLGTLGQGRLSSIAIDGGNVYVGGATSNAALTAGGQASIANAHSGGTDGFVMKIADSGSTATASFVSYVGTSLDESGMGLAVTGGAIYLAGSTNGNLSGGAAPERVNGYVVKLDGNGARLWSHQYQSVQGQAVATALAVDAQGASVLDKLGLPRAVAFDDTRLIAAGSTVRAGDNFSIRVNGGPILKITVSANDTMRSLTTRINSALVLKGEATLTRTGGDGVRITAKEGNVIELIPGKDGFDALAGLGLPAGKLDAVKKGSAAAANLSAKDRNLFALNLTDSVTAGDKLKARTATYQLAAAMETIRSAYLALTRPAPTNAQAQRAAASYSRIGG